MIRTILILALFLAGCDLLQKEEDPEPRDPAAEIQAHIQQFVIEAQARGVDVADEVAALQVTTEDEIIYDGQSLCGFAPWYADPESTDRTISFVTNDRCWLSLAEEDNEALVFHELGHMILDRWHRDDLLPNNRRASIMVSTSLAGLYVGNARDRRDYYLDELFDPETPVPDWGK